MSKKKTLPSTARQQPAVTLPSAAKASPAQDEASPFFKNTWLLAGILVAAAVAVYAQSLSNGFLIFDDDKAIKYNAIIKDPTFQGIFGSNNLGMYAPVTWLGYALVYALAGESAPAFHTFSLVLHIGCVVSVFGLLNLLQSRREVSFFAALLFAVHPIQAEAVCWIAGQSAVTFSFFYLLGLVAYAKWQQNERPVFYGLTLLLFVCSVLAKSAAVTFPLLLLAFDWYRNGTLTWKNLLGKVPFFAVSAALGLYTLTTRAAEGHNLVVTTKALSLFDRFLMVCHSLLFYPAKLLAPLGLSIYYPMEKTDGTWSFDYYLAPLVVGTLFFLVWKYRKNVREASLSALWYLMPLSVMLPYVTVGTLEMRSGRYVYLSSIGLFLLVVWFAQKLQPAVRRGILAAAAVLYGLLTIQHSQVWDNEVTVFQNCVDKYPDAVLCNCNLAYGQLLKFDYPNSVEHYTKTLALDPTYVEAFNGRGQAFFMLKRYDEAYSDFDNAIRAGIVTPRLFLNRGKCHVILNRPADALPDLARSLELEPRNPETYYFKGVAESQTGNPDQALVDYNKALDLQPNYTDVLANRALLLANQKRYEEAIADYTTVINGNPNIAMAWNNRAAAHLSLSRYDQALADVNRALELQPNYAIAYRTRASVYRGLGQMDKAMADMNRSLELQGARQ
ncbi:MAG: tetratricopeptide repeat protein [Saprospiraceae bacterium]